MQTAHPRLTGPWLPAVVALIALIPFGTVSDFGRNLLTTLIAVSFLIATLRLAVTVGPSHTPSHIFRFSTPIVVLTLPSYVALQAAAVATVGFSAGPAGEVYQSAAYLAVLAAYFLLAQSAISAPKDVRLLLGVLAGLGALEASYGVLNLISGNETLLGWPREYYPRSATGTLISRNHFAYLMEMLLPVTAAFAVVFAAGARRRARGRRSDESEESARRILISTLMILCGMGLLFARSRMGLISFGAAAVTVMILNRILAPANAGGGGRGPSSRTLNLGVGAFAIVATLMIGSDAILERFVSLDEDLRSGRLPIWHATFKMFADAPLLGHGWGTYEGLLPGYRPHPVGNYFDHAHSEYLEVLAEAGVFGFSILVGMLYMFARRLQRVLQKPLSELQRTVISFLALAVISVVYHSAADFGLRVPGVALTFLLVLALFCQVTENPALLDDSDSLSASDENRRRRARSA
jgi:O-antigen ligase